MKKIGLLFMMVAVVCTAALEGCHLASPAKGTKVGVITALADEGIFCTTHEGLLVRGGLSGGSGGIGTQVSFNIQDPSVLAEARKAMESGAEVEVDYERPLVASKCSREKNEDVTLTALRYKSSPSSFTLTPPPTVTFAPAIQFQDLSGSGGTLNPGDGGSGPGQ